MFGGHSFGAVYFGGAPRTAAKTITGTGDCTLAPATCSGAGTVPSHETAVTSTVGGGFFPFPMVQRRKLITGSIHVEVEPPQFRIEIEAWCAFTGAAACALASPEMQSYAVNKSAIARDDFLLSVGISLAGDG